MSCIFCICTLCPSFSCPAFPHVLQVRHFHSPVSHVTPRRVVASCTMWAMWYIAIHAVTRCRTTWLLVRSTANKCIYNKHACTIFGLYDWRTLMCANFLCCLFEFKPCYASSAVSVFLSTTTDSMSRFCVNWLCQVLILCCSTVALFLLDLSVRQNCVVDL